MSACVWTCMHVRACGVCGLGLAATGRGQVGLAGALSKLERLMIGREFIDLVEADQKVNWEKARTVYL